MREREQHGPRVTRELPARRSQPCLASALGRLQTTGSHPHREGGPGWGLGPRDGWKVPKILGPGGDVGKGSGEGTCSQVGWHLSRDLVKGLACAQRNQHCSESCPPLAGVVSAQELWGFWQLVPQMVWLAVQYSTRVGGAPATQGRTREALPAPSRSRSTRRVCRSLAAGPGVPPDVQSKLSPSVLARFNLPPAVPVRTAGWAPAPPAAV